jgi:hypothetical protein
MSDDAPDKPDHPLTALKRELKEIYDQAFSFAWTEIQAKVKESYHNGIEAGKASNGNGDKPRPTSNKRDWGRKRETA